RRRFGIRVRVLGERAGAGARRSRSALRKVLRGVIDQLKVLSIDPSGTCRLLATPPYAALRQGGAASWEPPGSLFQLSGLSGGPVRP
ncbi:hypothetical protein JYU34_007867, partial [Plutella xylostella]